MPQRFAVRLTAGAERDMRALHAYRLARAGPQAAADLLDAIVAAAESLHRFPNRGAVPPELQALGIAEYRQTLCGVHRLIYRVVDEVVFVLVIADGRRDMGALLERRLLAR